MPELPEVETVVSDLQAAGIIGRRVLEARVRWQRTIATPSAQAFVRRIRHQRIDAISRRAKYIVIGLSGGDTVLIHLRMTGRLTLTSGKVPRDPHEHVVLRLDDDSVLRYHDTRKFGRWYLLADASHKLDALGPEPLEASFTGRRFAERLAGRFGALKPLLLNQAFLAGLGNIYVDEALWDAKLHPEQSAGHLKPAQVQALYRGIRKVLRRGIRNLGTSLGDGDTNFYSVGGRRGRAQDQLRVFRRTGDPCPRCRTPIKRIIVGQRSTHLCPRCQIAR